MYNSKKGLLACAQHEISSARAATPGDDGMNMASKPTYPSTCNMVVRIAGPAHRRIILFDYIPSRTTEALKSLLIGTEGPFPGKLLTDGLELYDQVAAQWGIKHFGCAQHARTYFHKALKVTELPSGRSLARVAMEDYLGKMFRIERQIKEERESRERDGGVLTPEEVVQWRRERSAPILTAFKAWVDDLLLGTTPQSALGKSLAYTARQWPKLVLHFEHGEVPIRRVSDWRGKHRLRGVTVSRQSRCLSPRRMSRFQSLLVEPDVQISRIRLSRVSLRPSLSSRLLGCRGVCRGRASRTDTRPDTGGIQCLASPLAASAIAADGARCISG